MGMVSISAGVKKPTSSLQAGLLPDLADHGVGDALADLHAAARD
jgi:hypothetical protein